MLNPWVMHHAESIGRGMQSLSLREKMCCLH